MLRSSILLYRNAYSGLSTPVWWLSLVMLVNRSGTMVIPFLTVYLREDLGFSISEAGWVMGCFGVGSLLGGFFGGKLTDRVGFYGVQFWSLVLSGLLFILLSKMNSFWQVSLATLLLSTVNESFRPANGAAIAYYSSPENRTRSYSLNRLAINLGFSIGPALGGIIASASYEWLFWIDGFTCVMAALLLRFALPPVKGDKQIRHEKQVKNLESAFRDKVYMQFMFFVFLTGFCFLLLFSIVPMYYKEVVQMSKLTIGLLLGANGLLIVFIEMVLVYKLEQKQSHVHVMGIGTFLIGLSFLVLNIAPVFAIAVLGMLIVTFGEMLLFPFVNTYWVGRSKEHNRGQYAAVFTMSFALAHIFAPTVGAQIVNHFGYSALWYSAFGICTVAAVGFNQILKKKG
jgi:predicted MFS family arabinose efflux permease